MKNQKIIAKTLAEWAGISGLDFALLDQACRTLISTTPFRLPAESRIRSFLESPALCMGTGNVSLWKIRSGQGDEPQYLLAVHGRHESLSTIGELAVCQVQSLLEAAAEKESKGSFVRELLLGKAEFPEASAKASRLHMNPDTPRAVLLIETKAPADETVRMTLASLVSASGDQLVTMENNRLALLRELDPDEGEDQAVALARGIVDTLASEAMTDVRVSCSNPITHLDQAAGAYLETVTAMEVGRIFYDRSQVYAYQKLGIGRLIYSLPEEVCELFVREVFGEEDPTELDQETLSTVRTLFENNLNMSETARQLYMHRNTLAYRFDKLQKRLGLDVRTFEDALTFRIVMMVVDFMNKR